MTRKKMMLSKRILTCIFLLVVTVVNIKPTVSLAITDDLTHPSSESRVFDNVSAEFISQVSELVQTYWESDYFSSITLEIGEPTMLVDGEAVDIIPASVDGEDTVLLPVTAIADAVGANTEVDEQTGRIVVTDSGKTDTIGTSLDVPLDTDPIPTAVAAMDEVAEALGLEAVLYGDTVMLTKPYQTKQIIVRTMDGKELSDDHGAIASVNDGGGLYLLQYATEEEAKSADASFQLQKGIQYAVPNSVFKAAATGKNRLSERWGSERIESDRYIEYLGKQKTIGGGTASGTEVIVAVLDTGVDVAHEHLAGRTAGGYDIVEDDAIPEDVYGHGTHVSGIIVDTTPDNVKLMPVKVLDDYGAGTELQVSLGIAYAVEQGAEVINMSLGGRTNDDEFIRPITEAVDMAVKAGVSIIVGAGNDGYLTDYVYPACIPECITVAAVDDYDGKANFSNYGEAVDIAAPGVDILSSTPDNTYETWSGTSMATPYVAAAVAMLRLEYPGYSPEQLETLVETATVDCGESGEDWLYGAGRLDFGVFLGDDEPATGMTLNVMEITFEKGMLSYPVSLYGIVDPVDATNKSVILTSSDETVVTCENSQAIYSGSGNATITATLASNPSITATCEVSAKKPENWIEYATGEYEGGTGTEEDPYLIATAEQLAKISYDAFVEGELYGTLISTEDGMEAVDQAYFKLIADIDLAGKDWIPPYYYGYYGDHNKMFLGNFDGNGKSIRNLSSRYSVNGGLLRDMGYNVIKNLAVVDAYISQQSGILASDAVGSVVQNCYTTGYVDGTGLILCTWDTKIYNSYSLADVTHAGLIWLCYKTEIYNSYYAGDFIDIEMWASSENNGLAYNGLFDWLEDSKVVNSFSAGIVQLFGGFGYFKKSGDISHSYYLSDNHSGLHGDEKPETTDLNPVDIDFFQNKNNFTNLANWDGSHPWDFQDVWTIDNDKNNGLPYLSMFAVPDSCILLFNSNGGSKVAAIKNAVPGSLAAEPDPPVREGYDFAGWYKDKTFENKWDFANDNVRGYVYIHAKWVSNVKGDVNEDAKITLSDAKIILGAALKFVILEENAKKNSDVNGDGKTTLKDAQIVLRAALGIITL